MEAQSVAKQAKLEAKFDRQITQALQQHMERNPPIAAQPPPDYTRMFENHDRQIQILTTMISQMIPPQATAPNTTAGKRSAVIDLLQWRLTRCTEITRHMQISKEMTGSDLISGELPIKWHLRPTTIRVPRLQMDADILHRHHYMPLTLFIHRLCAISRRILANSIMIMIWIAQCVIQTRGIRCIQVRKMTTAPSETIGPRPSPRNLSVFDPVRSTR